MVQWRLEGLMHVPADDKNSECLEIAELKKELEKLRQENAKIAKTAEMFRIFVDNSIDAIWRLDEQFHFVYVSSSAKNLLGFSGEELVGKHLFSILTSESVDIVTRGFAERQPLLAQNKHWESSTYTVEVVHQDGHPIWVEVTVNPIFDANMHLLGFNGVTRDISERRRNEEVIRRYAFRDPLTNLPNRRQFENALTQAVKQSKQLDKKFAVIFLDIDGLKKVNDKYGHIFGDALLKAVAGRFRRAVRKQDFVARLAGDEFMAMLPDIGEKVDVKSIALRLIASCRQPVIIGKEKVHIGISVGISFFPADADDVATLMNYADQAMYRAKTAGGNNYICYG
jgi:diguanylate cyclase (GGDEF)-like protein/PAS domain S-box-containing protein